MVMVSLVVADAGWAGPKNYVASYGLDTNQCTLTSPGRSFAHAVDVTDDEGEVIVELRSLSNGNHQSNYRGILTLCS
jgi:hypothetical protein